MPVIEETPGGTGASRQDVQAFIERMDARLWIGHDLIGHRQLNKAPAHDDQLALRCDITCA
jgi:hypothetical protein